MKARDLLKPSESAIVIFTKGTKLEIPRMVVVQQVIGSSTRSASIIVSLFMNAGVPGMKSL